MNKKERKIRSVRMIKYNKTNKDYSFTQTIKYKENMSLVTKGKGCKMIKNKESGKVYNSLNDAAKDVELSISYLSQMLNNKRNNNTNLIWN